MSETKVYLIGAGPGDPGLFTIKGLECLKKSDVIIYDNLVNPGLIAHAKKGAELIFAGKSPKGHTLTQEQINRLLVKKASSGKTVARLKGGDPLLFGRGAEEAQALISQGLSFEIIPGVTSALAVPTYAGIPLTHRKISSGVTVITGHEDPSKKSSSISWDKLVQKGTTLVILMGMGNLARITKRLIAAGASPKLPVAVISNGTLPKQKVLTGNLGNIALGVKHSGFKPPAVIVIGRVVNLRGRLDWFGRKELSLAGKKILVTRPKGQIEEFARILKEKGARVIKLPLIEIVPQEDTPLIRRALGKINNFDWIVFTSTNGVDCFFRVLKNKRIAISRLSKIKFAAIGSRTAKRLKSFGLKAEVVPEKFRQEELGRAIVKRIGSGKRLLLAQAEESRDVLARMLRGKGVEVTRIAIYRTRPVSRHGGRLRETFRKQRIDAVTLTSSSCVKAFAGMMGSKMDELLRQTRVAVIGPVCLDSARKLGLKVDVVPQDYTIEGLTQALADYYGGGQDA